MGSRLYEEFMKKLKVPPVQRFNKKQENKEIVIAIPLKGGQGVILYSHQYLQQPVELDDNFVKVIQYEYAVRYLEQIGIEPNAKNIANLLKTAPLSSCEFSPGWNNSGWLADVLYIYPNKVKKQSFESNREAILQMKDQQNKSKEGPNNENDPFNNFLNNNTGGTQDYKDGNKEQNQKSNAKSKAKHIYDMNVNRFHQFHDESIKKYNQWMKKREEQNVDTIKKDLEQKKKNELNLDLDYWKKKFLYPYALDTAPLKNSETTPQDMVQQTKVLEKLGKTKNFNILETTALQFPLSQIQNKEEFLTELQSPIQITIEEIIKDMYKYTKEFPIKVIPHITENQEINDIIHNYKKSQNAAKTQTNLMNQKQSIGMNLLQSQQQAKKNNLALEQTKPNLQEQDIMRALKEIQSEKVARIIGLCCHLVYWSVFGHINQLPLDSYHKKLLFISIAQIQSELESKYTGKRTFATFIMPMIILAIRMEIEIIFKNGFAEFFSKSVHEKIAMKLINDVITNLLDPNLYYSRFSFLESGMEAINIKYEKSKTSTLPKIRNKFYTRSALVSQLIPNPSEGKVRAIFGAEKTNYGAVIHTAQPGQRKRTDTAIDFNRGGTMTAQGNQRIRMNSYMTQKQSAPNLGQAQEEMDTGLDLLNRVQMFQIAVNKINHNLEVRKKEPIFKLASNSGNDHIVHNRK